MDTEAKGPQPVRTWVLAALLGHEPNVGDTFSADGQEWVVGEFVGDYCLVSPVELPQVEVLVRYG